MKRTKKTDFQVDAILTTDWHLREDTPVCRTDDFQEAQWRKVDEAQRLQQKYKCLVLHAGDLFHHWKPSPWLLSKAIKHLPENFHTVYGQHDMPQNNIDLIEKSGVHTLKEAGFVEVLNEGHWGEVPTDRESIQLKGRKIAVWHIMNYIDKPPYPGCEAPKSNKLLRNYPNFDLIVTGDNHQRFVAREGSRVLVNAGPLTRQSADDNGEPAVYLYDATQNKIKEHVLSFDENAVTREHIEKKEERDERIQAFVKRLNEDWETSLNFKQNLERFAEKNKIDKEIMNVVYKATEEE